MKGEYDVKVVKHAARLGAELGADMVKVPYTGSSESFHEVVEGCSVPVVIAGGEKIETDKDDFIYGQRGDGRRRSARVHREKCFSTQGSGEDRQSLISQIVHKGVTVEEGMKELKGR